MKKIVVFIIVAVMTTYFAIAQDSGFSVGVEAGVINFKDSYDMIDSIVDTTYIMPTLGYEGYLISENLEFNAELGVPFWFFSDFWLGIDLDINLAYNMGNLSLIAENFLRIPVIKDARSPNSILFSKNNHFTTDGIFSPSNRYSKTYDYLSPGVKYNLFFNTGTLYFQADFPFMFIPDAFDYVRANLGIGWQGENGLGIKVKEYNNIKPDLEFLQRLDLTASYDTGSFYGGLDVGVPLWDYDSYTKAMEVYGITIIPKVEFRSENGFKFYANLPVYGLGSDNDIMFGLAIGIRKSF